MQWVQQLNQNNVDNLNNVRREASRHFRNNERTSESENWWHGTNNKI